MEEQALAIFNQAAEQMRFERSLQWQIAEYAVLAYAALAAVWLVLDRAGWDTWWVRLIAVFLVIATWYQALDGLYNAEARRVLADERQRGAIEELRIAACGELTKEECDTLPLIDNIFRDKRPVDPSERFILFRPPWAGLLPPFPYGLAAALSVGALIAIAVVFSRREAAARGGLAVPSRDAHDR